MRNRAKCKLCGDLLESFHHYDFVTCKCGEISIDGGQTMFKASAKDFNNFLRIDDNGKEVAVKVIDSNEDVEIKEVDTKPTREEMIKGFIDLVKSYDNLPEAAMRQPVSHFDFYSVLVILAALLREEK